MTWLHDSSRDVDQAVHAVEIDERAEVDDVRDRALDDVARIELVENRLAHLLALVLEDGATREHDVVARAVELDHLAAQLLAHVLVQVLDATDVDERRRQEAAHAEVEDQAALDDLDHATRHGLALLVRLLDRLPRDLEARALLREDQPALGVLLRHHERGDLVADRDLVGRVDRPPDRKLADGNDAFRLVADVDEHLVLVHADDRAVDDLALVDRREGRLVVGDQLARLGVRASRRPLRGGSSSLGSLIVSLAIRSAEYSPGYSDARAGIGLVPPAYGGKRPPDSVESPICPDRPQRVTVLELFFDLVFVFTITQLTAVVDHDPAHARAGAGRRSCWA